MARLSKEMREAVILVGAQGVSYREAPRICGCPIGTIRSRVHRARACLAARLSIESAADLAADPRCNRSGFAQRPRDPLYALNFRDQSEIHSQKEVASRIDLTAGKRAEYCGAVADVVYEATIAANPIVQRRPACRSSE